MRLSLLTLLLGCGDGDAVDEIDSGEPAVSDCRADWDSWASGFFTTYCRACHAESSPERFEAPLSVNLDSIDDARFWSDRIRQRVLIDQTMPVGGGVPSPELDRLEAWLDCLEVSP